MFDLIEARKSLKTRLSQEHISELKKFQALRFRTIQHFIYRVLFSKNLKALATIYGTDKWGSHWYAQHYEKHFCHLRNKPLNILEIGIGGYENPEMGGSSLRMWRAYFPKAKIFGIDICDKSCHNEKRIKTFKGSQIDNAFLDEFIKEIGTIDIIIDDGSHINDHIIHSFKFLFPKMSEYGFYVIEDLQTSYWFEYGGYSPGDKKSKTAMDFLKDLTDGLNYTEYKSSDYSPSYFDQHIKSIHFYHNLAFIEKGANG